MANSKDQKFKITMLCVVITVLILLYGCFNYINVSNEENPIRDLKIEWLTISSDSLNTSSSNLYNMTTATIITSLIFREPLMKNESIVIESASCNIKGAVDEVNVTIGLIDKGRFGLDIYHPILSSRVKTANPDWSVHRIKKSIKVSNPDRFGEYHFIYKVEIEKEYKSLFTESKEITIAGVDPMQKIYMDFNKSILKLTYILVMLGSIPFGLALREFLIKINEGLRFMDIIDKYTMAFFDRVKEYRIWKK